MRKFKGSYVRLSAGTTESSPSRGVGQTPRQRHGPARLLLASASPMSEQCGETPNDWVKRRSARPVLKHFKGESLHRKEPCNVSGVCVRLTINFYDVLLLR